MPIIIPNSDSASVCEKPKDCKLIGIIIDMSIPTADDIVLTAVIGLLVFNRFLNSYFGCEKYPPFLI